MASVIGLAPIRPCLKDRLLELLCIHGLKEMERWSIGCWGVGELEFWSADRSALHHSKNPTTPLALRLAHLVSEQRTERRDHRDEPGFHERLDHCINVLVSLRS